METFVNILKLAAGTGLFLFAMYLLEESLKNLSGRTFKLFLQRATKNRVSAAAGGAVVTSVLQSSSMVSLMVLAFVGAGVFNLRNALAIILGANFGTTIDSWLVATVGFKANLDLIAYPAICIGGFLLILFSNRKSLKYLSYFLLGFGLLFIGLSFMKMAMTAEVKNFDFSHYAKMPLIVFLAIGFVLTLIVQSSSVTMALTLSAMHAGAIELAPAAALVLGSETGTTIKILLSSLGGTAAKKRVALGNLLFNIFLTITAFLLLHPILSLITSTFGISDPLISLVTFSSIVNLLGILSFLPLLDVFTKFLERFYKDTDASAAAFIGNASSSEPETALDLFRREAEYFIHNSMLFNLLQFDVNISSYQSKSTFKKINERKKFFSKTNEEQYEFLKQLQGELQTFYIELRIKLDENQNPELNQLISSVRSAMHSVKSITDISSNISNLKRSSKDIKFDFFINHKKETEQLYRDLYSLFCGEKKADFEEFERIYNEIQENYSSALNTFYKEAQQAPMEDLDMTVIINFNRELFTSNKALLIAIKDFILDEKQADAFNELSVYKT